MDTDKILENMKAVLRNTKNKRKHSKFSGNNKKGENNNTINLEEQLAEEMNKSWVFKSPPLSNDKRAGENGSSPKVNAFEKMMKSRSELPLNQLIPEQQNNGNKKERKHQKNLKIIELITSDDDSIIEDVEVKSLEVPAKPGAFRRKGMISPVIRSPKEKYTFGIGNETEEIITTRKRTRTHVHDVALYTAEDNFPKKRRTRETTATIEKELGTKELQLPDAAGTSKCQSRRPRRSCAIKVDYSLSISPEKVIHVLDYAPKKRIEKSQNAGNDNSIEIIDVCGSSPDKEEQSHKQSIKLAPLFVKKIPKPSIDLTVFEARRNFLHLGLPNELRTQIDRKKQTDDEILSKELIAYPLISHVTQLLSADEMSRHNLCSLSAVKIYCDSNEWDEHYPLEPLKYGLFTECHVEKNVNMVTSKVELFERTANVKDLVKELQDDTTNFPVNRCFKLLRRKWQSAHDSSNHNIESDNGISVQNSLFVDIFKPVKFEDFFFGLKSLQELQEFLSIWNKDTLSYKTTHDSDSDSQYSAKGLNNFAVLSGKNGTSKTASVYALANDLNYQVIEINAGSRRSGKKILQDLLEATQSHRVKKHKSARSILSQDDQRYDISSQLSTDESAVFDEKTIILIEDAELQFESDDGFIASIQQLINISKRPVILTTNEHNCHHLQKFIQANCINYAQSPKVSKRVAKYLSLMCLVANYRINALEIESLYDQNGGDLRKTINEMEFFIRSSNPLHDTESLTSFYNRHWSLPRPVSQLTYHEEKGLSVMCFESSIASHYNVLDSERNVKENSQQNTLMKEIVHFLERGVSILHRDRLKGTIYSSISDNLTTQSTSNRLLTRAERLDYDFSLRQMCRSERTRLKEARTSRGHYMRSLLDSRFTSNAYLNEQCKILML